MTSCALSVNLRDRPMVCIMLLLYHIISMAHLYNGGAFMFLLSCAPKQERDAGSGFDVRRSEKYQYVTVICVVALETESALSNSERKVAMDASISSIFLATLAGSTTSTVFLSI